MASGTLSRLRRQYQPSPGLLLHDWGDSAAVVFVAASGTTHLIEGDLAALLASWDDESSFPGNSLTPEDDGWLEAQMPTLLQTGIFQARPAP